MKKILLIEDFATFASFIKGFLHEQDYVVQVANTGSKGIEKLTSFKPDLVLLDISLPDMNGLDVIESVIDYCDLIPIIVVSGSNSISTAVEAVHKGAWDFIEKPFYETSILTKAIEKALEKSKYVREEREYFSRLKRHSEDAKQMQKRFFPDVKVSFGEYTLESCILPSIGGSGDFVDYFQIDDTRFGFYVADVSGHGVAASFLTVVLKSFVALYVRQYNRLQDDTILCPGKVLTMINSDLLKQNFSRQVSLFYGIIDQNKQTLKYANSGLYPNPFLVDVTGKYSALEENSIPLGVIENKEYSSNAIQLPKKCLMAFFTDGILEILSDADKEQHRQYLPTMIDSLSIDKDVLEEKIQQLLDKRDLKKVPDDISFLLIKKSLNEISKVVN